MLMGKRTKPTMVLILHGYQKLKTHFLTLFTIRGQNLLLFFCGKSLVCVDSLWYDGSCMIKAICDSLQICWCSKQPVFGDYPVFGFMEVVEPGLMLGLERSFLLFTFWCICIKSSGYFPANFSCFHLYLRCASYIVDQAS